MSKHRIVLVGCGGISRAWLNAVTTHFNDRVELVGLVDLNVDNCRARQADFGLEGIPVSDDFGGMLADLKPDAVFNCTTPNAHHPLVLQALRAGCHCLVEKPLANTVEQGRELVEAAKTAGKTFAVIQNRRYDPNIRTVRGIVAAGTLGTVHTVNVDFYKGVHFGGFREEMEHVLLLDMAIHTFDQGRFIVGGQPVSVYCREYNPPGSWFRHDASAQAMFTLSDGTVYNYRGSWCADGFQTSWQGSWRLVGEKGTLLWDGEDGIQVEVIDPDRDGSASGYRSVDVVHEERPPASCGHAGVIEDFLNALDSGDDPLTVGYDNIHSLAMVEKAIESAETGQVVDIHT
ncbi:MAG: Gfo/Idh/MocA family protein [Opitutales bacterium]